MEVNSIEVKCGRKWFKIPPSAFIVKGNTITFKQGFPKKSIIRTVINKRKYTQEYDWSKIDLTKSA